MEAVMDEADVRAAALILDDSGELKLPAVGRDHATQKQKPPDHSDGFGPFEGWPCDVVLGLTCEFLRLGRS